METGIVRVASPPMMERRKKVEVEVKEEVYDGWWVDAMEKTEVKCGTSS